MHIRLVEFYPGVKAKDPLYMGSLHVALPGLGIQIRGIEVLKFPSSNRFFFNLPKKRSQQVALGRTDPWTTYDIISFDDEEKKNELISFLHEKGTPFVMSFPEIQERILSSYAHKSRKSKPSAVKHAKP